MFFLINSDNIIIITKTKVDKFGFSTDFYLKNLPHSVVIFDFVSSVFNLYTVDELIHVQLIIIKWETKLTQLRIGIMNIRILFIFDEDILFTLFAVKRMDIWLKIFLTFVVSHKVKMKRLVVNTTCMELAKPSNQQYRLTCRQLDYHCLLDDTYTQEIEVCREWKWIPEG